MLTFLNRSADNAENIKEVVFLYTKRIAYFSMDTGIYNDMFTYSGGLGILSGDTSKEVMDNPEVYPMTFFHILWKKGYSLQRVNERGEVTDHEPQGNMWEKYVEDTGREVEVSIFGKPVAVKIWKLKNGPVYYLDTDMEKNGEFCNITHYLYGGAWNDSSKERIAQEIVLGVGGVRAIEALGLQIDGYHYNDGHPAFAGLELISKRMKFYEKTDPILSEEGRFTRAWRHVKERTAFTTHTNVPAGNESHSIDLLMEVGANVDLSYNQLERIGGNPFGMTVASLRLAYKANGVSRIQVMAAKDMWSWIESAPDIIAITNGVHPGTWWNPAIKNAYMNNDIEGIYNAHSKCKDELIDLIKERTGVQFRKESILIAFARRATEYKRWNLIFRDRERFEYLVKNHDIQLVFAGKAHRHDTVGKRFISEIWHLSKQYPNNIVFLEGYNIELAQKLVAGADVWLNNPRVPLEACGTSGMKAALNGCINLSTLDGWYREAAIHGVNGFNIGTGNYGSNFHDEDDVKALMHVLKYEVLPAFNDKRRWMTMMHASITTAHQYTTGRMLDEYYINLYNYLKT